MEEAEALSTRIGIMVKGGQFKCFGSSQQIRNKFSKYYEVIKIILKLSDIDSPFNGRSRSSLN